MYFFCTYFDHHYLPRGLALYKSLKRHCPAFQLWVLCMDSISHEVLSKLQLSDLHLIALEDFEKGDEELLSAKQNRTLIEYYFTCTPSLPLFILNHWPEVDVITYLDADLFFFADPKPIYDEIADRSVAIIGHRFPAHLRELERHGIYNVGWLTFRRDEYGFQCLRWWRQRCIEWCYDRCEDGRFADQKYLDDWPSLFKGVVVLDHKGANLAPWNLANYMIRREGNSIWVDEHHLIFYHFHGLKPINDWLYDPSLAWYKAKPSKVVRRSIYAPYIRTLFEMIRQIPPLLQKDSLRGGIRDPMPMPQLTLSVLRRLKRLLVLWRGIFTQKYIFAMKGRVI